MNCAARAKAAHDAKEKFGGRHGTSVARHAILSEGCVLAVSGGPDSVALLHAVVDLFRAAGSAAALIVCHMNHGLRGAESDGDEAFVRSLFATLTAQSAVPRMQLACTRKDVVGQAHSQKENLEAMARKLRYAWLAEQARTHAVRWVLTAHTLNDQAETTLFHILRGTGIRGLRGMLPIRRLADGIRLFRPWLTIEKAAILAYLNERGFEYRTDSSNGDTRFTRNRIRQELLPKLQADYNARIHEALAGLARHARHASSLLNAQTKRMLEKAERPRVESLLIFDTDALKRLSLDSLQALYAHIWRREGWPRGRMGRREWESLARWTHDSSAGMDLPDGIRAMKKRGVVQLGPRK